MGTCSGLFPGLKLKVSHSGNSLSPQKMGKNSVGKAGKKCMSALLFIKIITLLL